MTAAEFHLPLLVLRCQAGDERAFVKIHTMFAPRTLRYLSGLVGDDADDVQQDVWIAVYRGLARLDNPAAFRTWLFQLTRHRAIDCLRRRKRYAEMFDTTPPEIIDAMPADERDVALDDSPAIAAALLRLPGPQREVMSLRYRDDMSYTEIAAVVGCPVGTVRTRLHHAKRKLHEILNGEMA